MPYFPFPQRRVDVESLTDKEKGYAEIVIGRASSTKNRLPKEDNLFIDDRTVSKHHCAIRFLKDGTVEIRDTDSHHGTVVNSEKLISEEPMVLFPGDQIGLVCKQKDDDYVEMSSCKFILKYKGVQDGVAEFDHLDSTDKGEEFAGGLLANEQDLFSENDEDDDSVSPSVDSPAPRESNSFLAVVCSNMDLEIDKKREEAGNEEDDNEEEPLSSDLKYTKEYDEVLSESEDESYMPSDFVQSEKSKTDYLVIDSDEEAEDAEAYSENLNSYEVEAVDEEEEYFIEKVKPTSDMEESITGEVLKNLTSVIPGGEEDNHDAGIDHDAEYSTVVSIKEKTPDSSETSSGFTSVPPYVLEKNAVETLTALKDSVNESMQKNKQTLTALKESFKRRKETPSKLGKPFKVQKPKKKPLINKKAESNLKKELMTGFTGLLIGMSLGAGLTFSTLASLGKSMGA